MPYISHSGGRAGHAFIFADGDERVFANNYFIQAKLADRAKTLKFYYTFCEVEVSGERLDIIYEKIKDGRMVTISIDNDNASIRLTEPRVTNIVYISRSENEMRDEI
jgi:hypothetical protein